MHSSALSQMQDLWTIPHFKREPGLWSPTLPINVESYTRALSDDDPDINGRDEVQHLDEWTPEDLN